MSEKKKEYSLASNLFRLFLGLGILMHVFSKSYGKMIGNNVAGKCMFITAIIFYILAVLCFIGMFYNKILNLEQQITQIKKRLEKLENQKDLDG